MNEIKDGIINESQYNECPVKILWVLKEPNSNEDNWSYQSYLSKNQIADKRNKKNKDTLKYPIFKRILMSSYGLINNVEYKNINIFNHEVYGIGEKIAYINIKKTPGKSSSYYKVIENAYNKNKERLLEQIKAIDPDVIIFGNVIAYFLKDLKEIGWDFNKIHSIDKTNYYKTESGKIAINIFHPSARPKTIIDEDYFNQIFHIRSLLKIE